MARYLAWSKVRRKNRFPLVTMLEPLEACNLSCAGCGRVREYQDVIDRRLTVEECQTAVCAAGAPIVSISGGEPLLHSEIGEIVRGITDAGRFVYLCTNGLLLRDRLASFAPSPRLAFVVHLDGTEAVHDRVTGRPGTYQTALEAIAEALERGHRVCTNTTLFRGTDVRDVHRLFGTLTEMEVEGLMVSPGYAYEDVPDRELFLQRRESIDVFRSVLNSGNAFPFYNNPLYLDFLRGARHYECAAWTTVTYTVLGWRVPCYVLADEHADDVSALFASDLWERYGPGRDRRCANCMMHSSFEGASILHALSHPGSLVRLATGAWRR
jgi:hopanoid biosynthesis associated radical SAM protein HpnH